MEPTRNQKVDKYTGPKHLEPPTPEKKDMEVQPDPDVENYAEVGDNVQKSMDQALEFQNQQHERKERKSATASNPILLPYHH